MTKQERDELLHVATQLAAAMNTNGFIDTESIHLINEKAIRSRYGPNRKSKCGVWGMSKAKFTESPWEIDTSQHRIFVHSDDGLICEVSSDLEDAHLIAAAPEMYKMLENVLSYIEDDNIEGFIEHYHEAKDLLAKARG